MPRVLSAVSTSSGPAAVNNSRDTSQMQRDDGTHQYTRASVEPAAGDSSAWQQLLGSEEHRCARHLPLPACCCCRFRCSGVQGTSASLQPSPEPCALPSRQLIARRRLRWAASPTPEQPLQRSQQKQQPPGHPELCWRALQALHSGETQLRFTDSFGACGSPYRQMFLLSLVQSRAKSS
jgi:hypothetical protein